MKITFTALVLSIATTITAGNAYAQLQQPTSAKPIALTYTYYQQEAEQASPSDVPDPSHPAAEDPELDFPAAAAGGEECEDGPVHLFQPIHGVQIGGWVNGGGYQNSDGLSTGTGNAPVTFPIISDAPMLNQAWLYAEMALPDDPCCYGFGFRADYVFGTDAKFTQAYGDVGWDNSWDTGRDYGQAIPQLYAEYGNSDISVKVGHFFTLIGYEVVPAPQNFFYSHAYTMQYGEPFTHTGALVSKQVTDQIRVTGGWTAGWDSGFNNANDASTFLGSVSWTSCDEALTITYAVVAGDFGDGTAGVPGAETQGDIYMQSIVAVYDIHECLQYVFQTDLGINNNYDGLNNSADWGGVNQYLFYTVSDCVKFGTRLEWFSDDTGVRTGVAGDYYGATFGMNYSYSSNLVFRPEVRYDWYHGQGAPYANRTETDQFYYGIDAYLIF